MMKTKIKENLELLIDNYSIDQRDYCSDFYPINRLKKTITLDVSELSMEQFSKLTSKGCIKTTIKRNMTLEEIMNKYNITEDKVIKLIKKYSNETT